MTEVDRNTQRAIDGDRHASIELWDRVRRGVFDAEVMLWLRQVAENVLDAESKSAGRLRDAAIIRAIGLQGNVDKHRELRDFAQTLLGLGITRQAIIAGVRGQQGAAAAGGIDSAAYEDMTDAELGKMIDRELDKKRKKPS